MSLSRLGDAIFYGILAYAVLMLMAEALPSIGRRRKERAKRAKEKRRW